MFLASYLEGQLWTFRLLFKELYSCDSYVYSWFISSEILYEVLSHHCATLFHANIRVPQQHTVKKTAPSPCELAWYFCWKIS